MAKRLTSRQVKEIHDIAFVVVTRAKGDGHTMDELLSEAAYVAQRGEENGTNWPSLSLARRVVAVQALMDWESETGFNAYRHWSQEIKKGKKNAAEMAHMDAFLERYG